MVIEKTQLKFVRSEQTGQLIGFVSRHSKTKKLMGVRENSLFKKRICVIADDLKSNILPNVLYEVELKLMHQGTGYVVIAAEPILFKAKIELVVVPESVYQVKVSFGNKVIYFDPVKGKTASSNTLEGVLEILNQRIDIANPDEVISNFIDQANELLRIMKEGAVT